jgi:hypothetical protein
VLSVDVLADGLYQCDFEIAFVGAAAFAGAEPGCFGFGACGVKHDILAFGFPGWAIWPAVDAGGSYGSHEHIVVGCVAVKDNLPAIIGRELAKAKRHVVHVSTCGFSTQHKPTQAFHLSDSYL